jgi:hypothetical protein
MAKSWNPRYLAYCYPCSPQNQLALDRKLYPGGCMTGFILWVKARWREFDQMKGQRADDPDSRTDQKMREFDGWLLARAGITMSTTWPNDPRAARQVHACPTS